MNYLVLNVLQGDAILCLQVVEEDAECNILDIKIHLILVFGIGREARTTWAAMCLDSAGLYIPFDLVVKDGSTERLTLGWEVYGMQRGQGRGGDWEGRDGVACPII